MKIFYIRRTALSVCFAALILSVLLCSCASNSLSTTAGDATIQSSVASTTPLASVSGSDPSVQQAIDAADIDKIAAATGDTTIKGTITNVIYPPSSNQNITLYFNSGDAARVAIPAADFSKIPDLRNYVGKQIILTGSVVMGKNYPQVTLTDPASLKTVD